MLISSCPIHEVPFSNVLDTYNIIVYQSLRTTLDHVLKQKWIHAYVWLSHLKVFTWKYHNIVNQLNPIQNKVKKKRNYCTSNRGHYLSSLSSVQLHSHVQLFATPWTAAHQASIHHQLPAFTQTPVHWVGDAIQPSHPLSSPSPPAFYISQHHGLFRWVSSSHPVA